MKDSEDHDFREWSNSTYRHPKDSRLRRFVLSILVGIAVIYLAMFIQLPYFVFKPGTAEEIKPMVSIGKGTDTEKGALMLTTVGVTTTNAINYLIALVHPYEELQPKSSIFQKGETENEYSLRQEYVMLTSQSSAIEAAYKKAGVPYQIKHEGVRVMQLIPGLPGEKVLQAGDTLLRIDTKEIGESADLFDYIKTKKLDDEVQITFRRNHEELTASLELAALPLAQGEETPRAGLGIVPADMQSIQAENKDQQVTVAAGEIGGPSAGLMFSLEIYNQLVPEDITKGYRIAGTGTIDADGIVGAIGGIQHKVIAADKAKAEIFFAPKDIIPEKQAPILNYTTAVARAKEINSDMKIVEVETMQDALDYLKALPLKTE
ncbi:SepM family pheromone-processing serine protease [Paenibacillus eucommiae]|uniref:endopeptidase La n=1 Tax=Paenibacillus eucommiae TaxID=1355755 RepID=A0ABS4IUY7_9BACL|nr:SepM family pheromone-processing serine protease [Paenibacillus eucommiae]MBP1991383.1 PDZ domain-containing protein [Paenibacillus eucommiae]